MTGALTCPALAGIAALSFSPVLVIDSTQILKEDLFGVLTAIACLGALALLGPLCYGEQTAEARRRFIGGLAALTSASFGIAGIRAYFAAIVWAALACVLAAFLIRQRERLPRYALLSAVVLMCVWGAYEKGAGPHYRGPALQNLHLSPQAVADVPQTLVTIIDQARTGFLLTGGATNMSVSSDQASASPSEPLTQTPVTAIETGVSPSEPTPPATASIHVGGSRSAGIRNRIRLFSVGLAAVFVPISLLKAFSLVEFVGGRGLLPIADLDTIVLDVSLLFLLGLLYARRDTVGERWPFVLFGLTLSLATAALLGYVVTNFGTLVRMKSLLAIPIWMLVPALSRPGRHPRVERSVCDRKRPHQPIQSPSSAS